MDAADHARFADQFRKALEAGDTAMLCKIWAHVMPNLPQPKTEADAAIVMHRARTEAASISFDRRAYSHAWLTERGYPSGLPDALRPKAERIYPRVVSAVGIAVRSLSRHGKAGAAVIQQAMSDAVAEAYADGRQDPAYVTARMNEARARATDFIYR